LRVLLWGCASTVPTGLIEHVTGAGLIQDTILRSAGVSFFLIGPIEEGFKLLAVWMAIYRSPDFKEPIDGIFYAATAALGFASIENAIYLGQMGPDVLVSRVVFATPAHVLFSSMWGYSLGLARFKREGELTIVLRGFLMAALFHGLYNFLVAVDPKTAIVSLIPLMVFMGWLMARRIKEFRSASPFPPLAEGALVVCPQCGAYAPEEDEVCSRCGYPIYPVDPDEGRYCGWCRAPLSPLEPCRDRCPRCGHAVGLSHWCAPGI
jgi:RsiW-degrading membrane proteinase PrsW (M82 family)/rRNA maturation protein Nop10